MENQDSRKNMAVKNQYHEKSDLELKTEWTLPRQFPGGHPRLKYFYKTQQFVDVDLRQTELLWRVQYLHEKYCVELS